MAAWGTGGERITAANTAPQMLEELLFFSTKADLGETTILLDSDTGEELQEYIVGYGGQFHEQHLRLSQFLKFLQSALQFFAIMLSRNIPTVM